MLKTNWFQRFMVVFSIFALGYVCYIGIKNLFRYNKFKLEYERLVNVYQLEIKQQELYAKQLSNLRRESFWDFQIRKQLGYVKKGELVYKVIKEQQPTHGI